MSDLVVIVDDHPLLALGLKNHLERRGLTAAVVEPTAPDDTIERIEALDPDLILLDLDMPIEDGGLGLAGTLSGVGRRVAILTGSTDRAQWARSLERGAEAVLTKDEPLEDLIDQIDRLANGETVKPHQRAELDSEYRHIEAERVARLESFERLSERERQILAALMDGLSAGTLAQRDYVSVQTVRTQIKSVLAKLGVNSQLAAVARAHEAGWLLPSPIVAGSDAGHDDGESGSIASGLV
jgi:DNA-binding NarL/FixJ family response regulator